MVGGSIVGDIVGVQRENMRHKVTPCNGTTVLITVAPSPHAAALMRVIAAIPSGTGRPDASITVDQDGTVVSEHGGRTRGADAIEAVLWHLTRTVAALHPLPLHAGLVATPRGGVLLVGSSGAGKSTAAAGLAGGGRRVASDELAMVAQDGLSLNGLARPAVLRAEGHLLLSGGASAPAMIAATPTGVVARTPMTTSPVSPHVIMFLAREGASVTESVPPAEALVGLLGHLARPIVELDEVGLLALALLATRTPAVRAVSQELSVLAVLADEPRSPTAVDPPVVHEALADGDGPRRRRPAVVVDGHVVTIGADGVIHLLGGGAAQLMVLADGTDAATRTFEGLLARDRIGESVTATTAELTRLGLVSA